MELMHQIGFAFNFAWEKKNPVYCAPFLCFILRTSLLFLLFCLIYQNIGPIPNRKLTLSSLCC